MVQVVPVTQNYYKENDTKVVFVKKLKILKKGLAIIWYSYP